MPRGTTTRSPAWRRRRARPSLTSSSPSRTSIRSKPGGTARRILEHARHVFNERGIGGVGIREIARDLDMSPGNVSYHFPTKEALVAALLAQAHEENNALVDAPAGPLDFVTVDRILRAIMQRDLDHRWVMRDVVGLLVALPSLHSLHDRTQRTREARADHIVDGLIDAGLLERRTTARFRGELRQQLFAQVFFWLPAAIVAAPDRDPAERLDLHARAVLALFLGYCTPRGRRQLERLLMRDAGRTDSPRRGRGRVAVHARRAALREK
jgi:AcrR family transcriptional regulator